MNPGHELDSKITCSYSTCVTHFILMLSISPSKYTMYFLTFVDFFLVECSSLSRKSGFDLSFENDIFQSSLAKNNIHLRFRHKIRQVIEFIVNMK